MIIKRSTKPKSLARKPPREKRWEKSSRLSRIINKRSGIVLIFIVATIVLVGAASIYYLRTAKVEYPIDVSSETKSIDDQIESLDQAELRAVVDQTSDNADTTELKAKAKALERLNRSNEARSLYEQIAEQNDATGDDLAQYTYATAASGDLRRAIELARQAITRIETETGGAREGEGEDRRVSALKSSIEAWESEL